MFQAVIASPVTQIEPATWKSKGKWEPLFYTLEISDTFYNIRSQANIHLLTPVENDNYNLYIYIYIFFTGKQISKEISFQIAYSILHIYRVHSEKQKPAPVAMHSQSPV